MKERVVTFQNTVRVAWKFICHFGLYPKVLLDMLLLYLLRNVIIATLFMKVGTEELKPTRN